MVEDEIGRCFGSKSTSEIQFFVGWRTICGFLIKNNHSLMMIWETAAGDEELGWSSGKIGSIPSEIYDFWVWYHDSIR